MTGVYEMDKTKARFAGISVKPSDGLEPSTPSLSWSGVKGGLMPDRGRCRVDGTPRVARCGHRRRPGHASEGGSRGCPGKNRCCAPGLGNLGFIHYGNSGYAALERALARKQHVVVMHSSSCERLSLEIAHRTTIASILRSTDLGELRQFRRAQHQTVAAQRATVSTTTPTITNPIPATRIGVMCSPRKIAASTTVAAG